MRDRVAHRKYRRARRLLRRVKGFLEAPDGWTFVFADLRVGTPIGTMLGFDMDLRGCAHFGTSYIFLDYRESLLPTLVHECLHALYPNRKEADFYADELLVSEHMNASDAQELFRLLAARLPR